MPIKKESQVVTCTSDWLQIRGSHDPLFKFANLLEWLTEPRERVYLLLLIYYKGYIKENKRATRLKNT